MINTLTSTAFVLVLPAIMGFIFLIAIVNLLGNLTKKRNSQKYRELISDMYVVGMIKKFSEEDGIDLLKELREYNLIVKKEDMKEKDLDKAIEEHLKEKVAEKNEKLFG